MTRTQFKYGVLLFLLSCCFAYGYYEGGVSIGLRRAAWCAVGWFGCEAYRALQPARRTD